MTLVFVGPSLYGSPLKPAEGELWLPPAAQADIVSLVVEHKPEQIVLIDGVFNQNMSVWHKELMFALAQPFLKRIVGASSMGALRAADLREWGMIGIGKIFEWYRDGVTEDDSEVALAYHPDTYKPLTVPLCNIRAMLASNTFIPGEHALALPFAEFFYADRTPALINKTLGKEAAARFWDFYVDQKKLDAQEAIRFSRETQLSEPEKRPTLEDYNSHFFQALYERDRLVNGKRLYELEAELAFTREDYLNAINRSLALWLAGELKIPGSEAERLNHLQLAYEWSRPASLLTKSVLEWKGKYENEKKMSGLRGRV